MSAVIGRFLKIDLGRPNEEERTRIRANADFMERTAEVLRAAVSWVEAGHNGSGNESDNNLITKGLRRAARAKPDGAGTCNGGICILAAAEMVRLGRTGSVMHLTQAVGALELKRILKAATTLEDNADNLRAAVS